MKKSDVLKQERAAIESKINDLVSKATRSDDEDAEFDTLRAEFEGYNRKIEREEAAEKFQAARAAELPAIHEKTTNPSDYKFSKAIREMVMNNGVLTGLEAEMHQEAKRENPSLKGIGVPSFVINRAALAASGSKVVATNTVDFIEALRARLVVIQAGAKLMPGLKGNLSIPKLTGGNVVWNSETGNSADFAAAFGEVTMSPKRLTAYQTVSKQLLVQSEYAIEQIITGDMYRSVALAVDAAALEGGAANTPTGILNTSGIGSVECGTTGGALTWAKVVALENEVAVDNADLGALAFVTNPKVRAQLKGTSVGTDQRMVWSESGNSLMGYNAFVTTQVPSTLDKDTTTGVLSALIFGNFNDLMLGQWGGLDITMDPFTAALSAQVKIYIDSLWDVALRNAASFAAAKDIYTS